MKNCNDKDKVKDQIEDRKYRLISDIIYLLYNKFNS